MKIPEEEIELCYYCGHPATGYDHVIPRTVVMNLPTLSNYIPSQM